MSEDALSKRAVSPLSEARGREGAPRTIDTLAISIVLWYPSLVKYELKTTNNIAYICHYHVVSPLQQDKLLYKPHYKGHLEKVNGIPERCRVLAFSNVT